MHNEVDVRGLNARERWIRAEHAVIVKYVDIEESCMYPNG